VPDDLVRDRQVRLRYALRDTLIMLVPMLLVLATLIIWPEIALILPKLIGRNFSVAPDILRDPVQQRAPRRRIIGASMAQETVPMQPMPLSPKFGAEITGVDVASLSQTAFEDLERAFFDAQVLVLRDQKLTPTDYVAFAKRLGPPEPHVIDQFHHPADANILILSNRTRDGQPAGLADAGTYFHTDLLVPAGPARATMLYSIEVRGRRQHAVRQPVRRTTDYRRR
jgi:hypothetical protein